VGCGWFFFGALVGGGRGRERDNVRSPYNRVVFVGRLVLSNRPIFYFIYYILRCGGFVVSCFKTIVNVVPRASMTWTDTCALKFQQLDDLFHTWKTMEGLLHLVPSRTPRNSWYGVLYTCVICYMLYVQGLGFRI
jgi:hypothetical protein